MERLDEVIATKVEELNEISVKDEKFKDAANAVCNLVETSEKLDIQREDLSNKKKDNIWGKVLLFATGVAVPFILNAFNNSKDDARLDKVLEYEKTGMIMSTGGKHALNSVLKKH
ncbi:MAG: hypothetical protein J6Y02_12655 [Pseudobutyrivibrio sp.]|nr:hypothetical protein [Pseudobutyrivibrio sp.]